MHCATCGHPGKPRDKFCSKCGAGLPLAGPSAARASHPRAAVALWLLSAVAAVGAAALVFLPQQIWGPRGAPDAAATPVYAVTKNGGAFSRDGLTVEIPAGLLANEIDFQTAKVSMAEAYTPRPGTLGAMKDAVVAVSDVFEVAPVFYAGQPVRFRIPLRADLAAKAIAPRRAGAAGFWVAYAAAPETPSSGGRFVLLRNDSPVSQGPAESTADKTLLEASHKGLVGGQYRVVYEESGAGPSAPPELPPPPPQALEMRAMRPEEYPIDQLNEHERAYLAAWALLGDQEPDADTPDQTLQTGGERMEQVARRESIWPLALRTRATFWAARCHDLLYRKNPSAVEHYHRALELYRETLRAWRESADSRQAKFATKLPTGPEERWASQAVTKGGYWATIYDHPYRVSDATVEHLNLIAPFGPEIYFYLEKGFNTSSGSPYSFFNGQPERATQPLDRTTLFVGGGRDFDQSEADVYEGPSGLATFMNAYPKSITSSVRAALGAQSFDPASVTIRVSRTIISPDRANRLGILSALGLLKNLLQRSVAGFVAGQVLSEALGLADRYTGALSAVPVVLQEYVVLPYREAPASQAAPRGSLTAVGESRLLTAGKVKETRNLSRYANTIFEGSLDSENPFDRKFLERILVRYQFTRPPLDRIGRNYYGYEPGKVAKVLFRQNNPVPMVQVVVSGVERRPGMQSPGFQQRHTRVLSFSLQLSFLERSAYSPRTDGQDVFGGDHAVLDAKWRPVWEWDQAPLVRESNGPVGVIFRARGVRGRSSSELLFHDVLGRDAGTSGRTGDSRPSAGAALLEPIRRALASNASVDVLDGARRLLTTAAQYYNAKRRPEIEGGMAAELEIGVREGELPIPVSSQYRRSFFVSSVPFVEGYTGIEQSAILRDGAVAFIEPDLPTTYKLIVTERMPAGVEKREFNVDLARLTGAQFSRSGPFLVATLSLEKLDYLKILEELADARQWPSRGFAREVKDDWPWWYGSSSKVELLERRRANVMQDPYAHFTASVENRTSIDIHVFETPERAAAEMQRVMEFRASQLQRYRNEGSQFQPYSMSVPGVLPYAANKSAGLQSWQEQWVRPLWHACPLWASLGDVLVSVAAGKPGRGREVQVDIEGADSVLREVVSRIANASGQGGRP